MGTRGRRLIDFCPDKPLTVQTLQFGTQSRNIMLKSVVNRSYKECEKTASLAKKEEKKKKRKEKKGRKTLWDGFAVPSGLEKKIAKRQLTKSAAFHPCRIKEFAIPCPHFPTELKTTIYHRR